MARKPQLKTFAATASDGTAVIVKAYLKENALRKVREYDAKIRSVYRWNEVINSQPCDELIETSPNTYAVQYRAE